MGQTLPPKDSPAPSELAPIAAGPFQGNLRSLMQNRFPKWFKEGKLGIWAHWGPQSVPMEGDWYARQMYEEGSKDYKDHLTRWGPDSVHGYKDLIPLWKAEKWDPERLMRLYKKAGAKYFVSMACHHDNFDLWNSKYHRWNAVKMGPHRDVVGDWQKAAKRNGLRFGVSEHMGASWTWFQASHGADKGGPNAGVPYDGNDPTYDDLYHQKALPGDNGWYSTDPRWHREWYRRVKDLVDSYHPDLLYSDGPLPFGDVGASIVANLYNVTMRDGVQQAVYTCKQPGEGRWTQDVERGVMGGIQPFPWQTDTSIGDWFYNKDWKFRGADWVIHTLVDVVSKNGNLLINVVQRPDGSLDPDAEKILADMAAWMSVNSESIYATKPWLVYGEGPTRSRGGAFQEDFGFTSEDVRYAQKGNGTVYATLMGKPTERQIVLRSLARHEGDAAEIKEVALLGHPGQVSWRQEPDGLHLTLPEGGYSDIASVIKITVRNPRAFTIVPQVAPPKATVTQEADGSYWLRPDRANLPDEDIQVEEKDGIPNLGYWNNSTSAANWTVDFAASGDYRVTGSFAVDSGTSILDVRVEGVESPVRIAPTGSWEKFVELPVGTIHVAHPGRVTVTAHPNNAYDWHALNLRWLKFEKM